MKWINRFYMLFIGIILSITTGFGIAAFYPQPIAPSYPQSNRIYRPVPVSCSQTPGASQTPDCQEYFSEQDAQSLKDQENQKKYEKDMQEYSNKNAGYTRTAIFFGITIGTFYAVIGLMLIKRSKIIATGLLLAAVLTALLTRLLISLASLGASVTGSEGTNMIGYVEFGILLFLSIAVISLGFTTLKEEVSH